MWNNLTKNSTSKHILSDHNLYRCENELLKYSGIPLSEISIKMVKLDEFDGEGVFKRTFIFGHEGTSLNKQKKPILVFIHGFAASGALFYKIFKHL